MRKDAFAVPAALHTAAREFRLLFVEDNSDDLALIQRELRAAGLAFTGDVVCDFEEFVRRIGEGPYDAVLSDFRLPGWEGLDALHELQRRGLDIPFLLITGTLGEEKAVECMKLGVTDYILKDHLARLPLALQQAVEGREGKERQQRIAEELWASESKLGLLLSQLPAIIWSTDCDLRITSLTGAGLANVSEAFRGREGFLLEQIFDPAHPAIAAHRRALAGDSVQFESEFHGREFESRVEPLRDIAGKVCGCLSISLDVTEKKTREGVLRSREEELGRANHTLGALISAAPVAIMALDREDRVRIWNPAAEQMFGWKLAEVLGRKIPYVPAARAEEHLLLVEVLAQGGRVSGFETQRMRRDESLIDVTLSTAVLPGGELRGGEPHLPATIAVLEDISARKRAEAEKLLLNTAIEQSADAVVISDPDGSIQYVNPAFCSMTGYARAEAVGHRTNLLNSGRHDAAFYRELWRTILGGQTWRGEFENKRKDGTIIPMEAVITPVRGPRGEISSYICIQHDVTERRSLERQFLQAQKFEAIGQLAGGIAHDFNNVLAAILGMAELAQLEAPEGTRVRERLEKICHHAGRAVALTRQLLAFSRQQQLERRDLNLNMCVAEITSLLSESLGSDIEVRTQLASGLAGVHADPAQIEQVLMNLCVNSRDAMPDGGTLTIATENTRLDELSARLQPSAKPGFYVRLSVSDTGMGMDAATLERIFEPFFTTKPQGRGTGLGLATVYGIVKQHGGFVEVTSSPGQGSVFRISLPSASPAEEESASKSEGEPVRGGNETILLAEDHEGLRELIRESLESLGYSVVMARDGLEAVELFERGRGEVALLVLDVIMPRLRGPEAYKRIRELDPTVPVLFCTGYSSDTALVETLSSHHVLHKPYPARDLARMVRSLLDLRAAEKKQPHGT
jgi:two-component system, cell cycle sensor histidine kinase and response regulator CckA